MISSRNTIEIHVNGEQCDLYSQDKLNLRINNVVFDPTSMQTKSGEYSFSFSLPVTPKNARIFNYANNSAKLGKFNAQYDCEVYADGTPVFKGTLRLSETTLTDFKANLVNIKINNVEDIFGEMKMDDLEWDVPFEGTSTINEVNRNLDTDYYFPLACYGVFPKLPYKTYGEDISEYTDLLYLDKYVRWYWESFHPSLRLTALIKKLFEARGYNVSGDFFDDANANSIFLSEYLSADQDPTYNLDNPKIGRLTIGGQFNNYKNLYEFATSENRVPSNIRYGIQDLNYPKEKITAAGQEDYYNLSKIYRYDIWGTPQGTWHTYINTPNNDYLWRKYKEGETGGYIMVPADGLYKIAMYFNRISIAETGTAGLKYTRKKYEYNPSSTTHQSYQLVDEAATLAHNLDDMTIEIHLVRNEMDTELIWTPDSEGYYYPHEMDARVYTTTTGRGGSSSTSGRTGTGTTIIGSGSRGSGEYQASGQRTQRGTTSGNRTTTGVAGSSTADVERYYPTNGQVVAYDPFASPYFICGVGTKGSHPACIKNGMSWNPICDEYNQNHYKCEGYMSKSADNNTTVRTDYNKNGLTGTNVDSMIHDTGVVGNANAWVNCVVELKKGDCLTLQAVTKYLNGVERTHSNGSTVIADGTYKIDIQYYLEFEPYSPNGDKFVNDKTLNWNNDSVMRQDHWGTDLRLANFMNSEEKVSDFINNVISTFNLRYTVSGNSVSLDKTKIDTSLGGYVNIDDRVCIKDATHSRIEYPSTMEVQFTIDEEEAGAYRSIDTIEHQGAYNWKTYIDRGSEKIVMDNTDSSTESTVTSKFSYNWFERFYYEPYDSATGNTSAERNLYLPLIAKDENFIIQNPDSAARDGLSLKQRMWYRQPMSGYEPLEMWNKEKVDITVPAGEKDGKTLDFYQNKGSLLDTYFNIEPMLESNFTTVQCYISPEEYIRLKNNSQVVLDNDIYFVSEISGFDPSGSNMTTLKLIKKVR